MSDGLCTLTALTWDGPLPLPGEHVKAPRGRTAFLIVRVDRARSPGLKHVAKFRCERRAASSLTDRDVVHAWYWSRR